MFAVKGWSVSADKLKVETENGRPIAATDGGSQSPATPVSAKNRKRKRPGNSQQAQSVTAANFADMWEKVIEQKDSYVAASKPLSRKERKLAKKGEQKTSQVDVVPPLSGDAPGQQRQKPETKQDKKGKKEISHPMDSVPDEKPTVADADEEEWGGFDEEPGTEATRIGDEDDEGRNDRKKKRRTESGTRKESDASGINTNTKSKSTPNKTSVPTSQPQPPQPPPAVKLTPLQASMREKLVSARFRHLNETLYTRHSADAFHLFQESPEMFNEYHEGFRRQVNVWPENPVDGFIRDIEARAKVRFPPKGVRHDFSNPIASIQLLPLPRNLRDGAACKIADLGCGDAALATRLQPKLSKLRINVQSFDLQTGGSPLITRADIANLPLADGSIDVAIFCLALMGTNWIDFVEEAYRVLRWKGELWVAEIKSRFANPSKKQKVVAHSVGNRRNPVAAAAAAGPGKKSKKAREAAEAGAEADEAELAVAVDGAELRKQETDISAFVDALRARGFLLHKELGQGAVELGNKMFVRMHFVKAAPATKGKCATEKGDLIDRAGPSGPARKPKFVVEEDGLDESAILKPCVYKLR